MVPRRTARLTALALGLALASSARPALADRPTAQALFDQGRTKLSAGRVAEACPLFEESLRLENALGTLLNLAACHEAEGKTASAWGEFRAAAAQAKQRGETERERVATERAKTLEPRLAQLVVRVDDATAQGLVVERDGVEVGPGQLGTPVPVDPGVHRIVARAPGHAAFTREVSLGERERNVVVVPKLVRLDAYPSRGEGLGAGRTVALGLGGAAVVAAGVGTYFGVASMRDASDADAQCAGDLCSPRGVVLREDALANGDRATVAFVGAGALLGAGVVLWLVAPPPGPSDRPRAVQATASGLRVAF